MLYRRFSGGGSSSESILINTTPFDTKGTKTGLILPIDFYPYDTNLNDWNQDFYNLLNLLHKYKQLPVVVILKITDFTQIDDNWQHAIKMIKASGTTVVGHIDSQNASKSLTDINQEINDWKQNYPDIDGIYVDKVSSNQSLISYYEQVNNKIKSQFFLSIGNPATIVDKSYFDIFDIVNINESGQIIDVNTIKQNYSETLSKKIAVIIKEQVNLDINYVRNLQDYIGYLYITDETDYTSLSNNLESLLITLATQPELITFTSDGKVGINNTEPKSTLDVLGSIGLPLKEINQNTILTDEDFTILVNSTDSAINIYLPSPEQNRIYLIRKISFDSNGISIKDDGIEILNITEPNRTVILQSDDNEWKVILDSIAGSSGGSAGLPPVDDITIGYDSLGRLYVKNNTMATISNADKVDGYDVDDNQKTGTLWTGRRITKESIIKAIIFG